MTFALCGLSVVQPERSIEQRAAAEVAKTFLGVNGREAHALASLFRRTQVCSRASVLLEPSADCEPRQSFYPPSAGPADRGPATAARMQRYAAETVPLAHAAAREALERSTIAPREVTHLITVSCTGFFAPGIDVALVKSLGLPPTVGRVHVGFMGCHGALNAFRVAEALVGSCPAARVLVCAVELCSLHYQYGTDPQHLVANALFADGAAAFVARRAQPGDGDLWQVAACGSCLVPDAEDAMTWRIGNHGFQMTLSPRVPDLIARHLKPWLEEWLAAEGLTIAEIGSWAVHPGGPRILSSVAEALGLPAGALDISAQVLAECGNMSSPTILFVLDRLRRAGVARPCVALGFGPGLIAEAALLAGQASETP